MKLSLHNGSSIGVTIISNIFIDYYMPQANGEFVKIYLYLLRCLNGGQTDLDLTAVADVFSCTESDILRTLRYWESRQLVALAGKDTVTSIDFLEPVLPSAVPASSIAPETVSTAKNTRKATDGKSSAKVQGKQDNRCISPMSQPHPEAAVTENSIQMQPENGKLSADRIKELQQEEDVRQMLFIAEQYLGTTLSRTVTDEFLYIYDQLHFSVDLIDYLIEYCVSKGSKDIHYIKKVAFNWYEAGIDSVTKAKQETTTYHRNYFTILKAFGISNRNPVASEINMINHWMKDYGFTLDILTEACTRTVAQTGKANFRYADKILADWKAKGVRHLTDIQALDTLHRQLQADREQQKSRQNTRTPSSGSGNRFNNFSQRDYNYNELENQLLNQP